ncbi:P-loop containing nucleoside triphosphate hydrolase protein [Ramicandelaber brevisporus]|nr:P-loop containing nucleoside triphosphate hydrolase protein [Ramicandelaber brevisporus]
MPASTRLARSTTFATVADPLVGSVKRRKVAGSSSTRSTAATAAVDENSNPQPSATTKVAVKQDSKLSSHFAPLKASSAIVASRNIKAAISKKSSLAEAKPTKPLSSAAATLASIPETKPQIAPTVATVEPSPKVSQATAAKNVLRSDVAPRRYVGRDEKRAELNSFFGRCLQSPGSLYISGQPGTGKTALLTDVLREMDSATATATATATTTNNEKTNVAKFEGVVYINCMTTKDPRKLYSKLLEGITGDSASSMTVDEAFTSLKSTLNIDSISTSSQPVKAARQRSASSRKLSSPKSAENDRQRSFLVVLDEIDNLLSRDNDVLYNLFSWASPMHPSSRLALVGIANALDMTARFLPRLTEHNCEPELLHFPPYDIKDIVAIVSDRFATACSAAGIGADAVVVHPKAIELCARKVASTSGDVRKALAVLQRAVEIADTDFKKTLAKSGADGSVAPKSLSISMVHVARALNAPAGPTVSSKITTLAIQHKLALAAVALSSPSESSNLASGQSVSAVYSRYQVLCKDSNVVAAVTRNELTDLITVLEADALVKQTAAVKAKTRSKATAAASAANSASGEAAVGLLVSIEDVRRFAIERTQPLALLSCYFMTEQ